MNVSNSKLLFWMEDSINKKALEHPGAKSVMIGMSGCSETVVCGLDGEEVEKQCPSTRAKVFLGAASGAGGTDGHSVTITEQVL